MVMNLTSAQHQNKVGFVADTSCANATDLLTCLYALSPSDIEGMSWQLVCRDRIEGGMGGWGIAHATLIFGSRCAGLTHALVLPVALCPCAVT